MTIVPTDQEHPDLQRVFQQWAAADDRGVLLLNSRRQILEINPLARRILDCSLDMPQPLGSIVRDMNVEFAIGDAIHDRKVVEHESLLAGPDHILRFRAIPILERTGHATHALVTVDDVTRLRHLETVRRDFVANVSHELRTPIASINLLVETLQTRGMNDPDAARHFLRRIEVETQAMNRLVEELLQLSQLESGRLSLKIEEVSVQQVVDEVRSRLAMMADEKEIALETDVQPKLPPVLADFSALEQVFMNLVHNAIKFTPEHGTVTLRARRNGPGVEVEVVDTGVGMEPLASDRVFERFYKVDKGRHRGTGTGLGLAIARHVLELQGSRLSVVSTPNEGSRFSFALPVAESE